MSAWAKSNPRGVAAYKNYRNSANTKNLNNWITLECPTCKSLFDKYKSETSRKYCSSKCRVTGGYRKESFRTGIKGYYNNIHCDSTWELAFLIYHLDHGNHIERQPIKLTYINSEGQRRHYYPDFKVNDQLYEIKGIITDNDLYKLRDNPQVIMIGGDDMKTIFAYISKRYNKTQKTIKELYHTIDTSGTPEQI
jgi:hypothetical protein